MRIRSRLDGTSSEAQLRLIHSCGLRRFVLAVQEPGGTRRSLGQLTAAIGYELVDAAASERAALKLAGFKLPQATTTVEGRLNSLVGLAHEPRPTTDRGHLRGPHLLTTYANRHRKLQRHRHAS